MYSTYIALLRGINVSGQKIIRMEDLRKVLEAEGFEKVKTYVQSGNLVFQTKTTSNTVVESKIIKLLKQNFGFDIPTLVLTSEQLYSVLQENIFAQDPKKDPAFLHATFLASLPSNTDLSGLDQKKTANEDYHLSGQVLYLYCPDGYGKTKLSNNFIENTLKTQATTRNWKSVNELFKLTQS